MAVLELFSSQRGELSVVQVAELLGKPKSTVARWLSSMAEAGFLERDRDSGRYHLSLRLAALGNVAQHATSIQRIAGPVLVGLAEETGETANLSVLSGLEAVNISVADSPQPIMHVGWVGRRLPVHASASGKALLAHAARMVVDAVIARGLVPFTERTITDPDALRRELDEVRRLGYATTWDEMEADLAAVAAPVRDHRSLVIAAVAVGGPVSRCPRDQLPALAEPVRRAARDLSTALGFLPGAASGTR